MLTIFKSKSSISESSFYRLKNYLLIMKPRVVFLLVLSAITGAISGSVGLPQNKINWQMIIWVIICGFLSSGGANAVNSWYDRDIDALMNRTRHRPIPAGLINPSWKALVWGLMSITFGFILGHIFLNTLSAIMILTGAIWYAFGYTMILKQRTHWNILFGGIAGAFPVFAGWAAARDSLNNLFPWLIGFIIWVWIPLHFWSLAIRYKNEYEDAKILMLPVVIGVEKTANYIGFAGIILSIAVFGMIFIPQTGIIFAVFAILLCFWIFKHTIRVLKDPTPDNSWTLFLVSNIFLMLIELNIILDAIVQIYFN